MGCIDISQRADGSLHESSINTEKDRLQALTIAAAAADREQQAEQVDLDQLDETALKQRLSGKDERVERGAVMVKGMAKQMREYLDAAQNAGESSDTLENIADELDRLARDLDLSAPDEH